VQKSIEVDLVLLGYYAHLLTALELSMVNTAKELHAPLRSRLRSSLGVGTILALVVRDAIHDLQRLPRVQALASYGRLVTGAKDSAGKRDGTAGSKIGNASLTGAFSEAAGLCLRAKPAGQQHCARLQKQHGQGNAFTVRAHHLARAVYSMEKRDTRFALAKLLHGITERSGCAGRLTGRLRDEPRQGTLA
jgi:transposase